MTKLNRVIRLARGEKLKIMAVARADTVIDASYVKIKNRGGAPGERASNAEVLAARRPYHSELE